MNCRECEIFSKCIFNSLNEKSLNELESLKTELKIVKDQFLFQHGDRADFIYCIKSLNCKITQPSQFKNSVKLIRIAGPGNIAGIRSIFHSDIYIGSSKAANNGEVCKIKKEDFINLIHQNPELSLRILTLLSKELSRAESSHIDQNNKNVKERLIDVYKKLFREIGFLNEEKKQILPNILTRKELASLIPASIENIIRINSELKREGLIDESFDGYIILNFKM